MVGREREAETQRDKGGGGGRGALRRGKRNDRSKEKTREISRVKRSVGQTGNAEEVFLETRIF